MSKVSQNTTNLLSNYKYEKSKSTKKKENVSNMPGADKSLARPGRKQATATKL